MRTGTRPQTGPEVGLSAPEPPSVRIAVARSTLLNLAADAAPVAASLVLLPHLVHGLGFDRFGLLTLAWSLIGYFSLFDLGLGRALTQAIADRLSRGVRHEMPDICRVGLLAITLLGVAGGTVLIALSPWLVHSAFHMPAPLAREAVASVRLLGVCLPLVLLAAGARGILEAYGRFDLTNSVRAPLGIFNFAGPAVVLLWSDSVFPVIQVLVAGRLIATGVLVVQCARVVPGLTRLRRVQTRGLHQLLSLGGWMTVSNLIGSLMSVLDRFLIGSMASVAAVAFYTTPYEMAAKIQIIPGALTRVLFPSFTFALARGDGPQRQFALALKSVGLVLLPITLAVFAFAPEGLRWWLGSEFALRSAPVLRWLILGMLVNSVALIPFTLVQAAGRADWTGKAHILELLPYLIILVLLLRRFGVAGAAAAWTIRVVLDCCIQFALAARVLKATRRLFARVWQGPLFALLAFAAAGLPASPLTRLAATGAVMLLLPIVAWIGILESHERTLLRRVLCARAPHLR